LLQLTDDFTDAEEYWRGLDIKRKALTEHHPTLENCKEIDLELQQL
jgi:hypothetical protein